MSDISKSITSNETATKQQRNNITNSQESAKIINMSEDEAKNSTAGNNKITKSGWLLKWTNYLKGM
jgi:hypothetical protein